jgi:hypothetical protein
VYSSSLVCNFSIFDLTMIVFWYQTYIE